MNGFSIKNIESEKEYLAPKIATTEDDICEIGVEIKEPFGLIKKWKHMGRRRYGLTVEMHDAVLATDLSPRIRAKMEAKNLGFHRDFGSNRLFVLTQNGKSFLFEVGDVLLPDPDHPVWG